MDLTTVISIIQILLYIILGGLALYFQANAKLKGTVSALISDAELEYKDTVKAGGLKHEYVVTVLYNMLPAYLKPIITKAMVSTIVDNAFTSIEAYTNQQLDKAVNKVIDKKVV